MRFALYGIVDKIEYKKIIIGGHNDSIEKLLRYKKENEKCPILEGNKVYISIKKPLPLDFIGEKVLVKVNVKKYKFESKFSHNIGEMIEGWNLQLIEIEKKNW